MIEHLGAEVLVLERHHAPRPRDPHQLAQHRVRPRHVQQHGHREGAVEAAGAQRQRRRVAQAEVQAAIEPLLAGATPRRRQQDPAAVDAGHAAARADERGHVARDHPAPRADLDDAPAGRDAAEAQEAPAQTDLGRTAPAGLHHPREALGPGLAVDGPPGIRMRGHGQAKRSGKSSRKSRSSPPSAAVGATRSAARRTSSGACGMATPRPASRSISTSFS